MTKLRKAIMALCIVAALLSGGSLLHESLQKSESAQEIAELQNISAEETTEAEPEAMAEETEPETAPYQKPEKLQAAEDQSDYVVGWIDCRGSESAIHYPIVQNTSDNEFFLHRNYQGEKNGVVGSIYMDAAHDINVKGLHVIYGHHMKGSNRKENWMFRELSQFSNLEVLSDDEKTFDIYSDQGMVTVKAVYAYAGKADGRYRSTIMGKDNLHEFFQEVTGWDSGDADNAFVLITCDYSVKDGRMYVICVPASES